MWKRPRSWIILLAFVGVAFVVYFEPSHCVRGWLKGEAFFEGRPTSWWRGVLVCDLHSDPRADWLQAVNPPPRSRLWDHVDDCKKWIGFESDTRSSLMIASYAREQDADACKVFDALALDENKNVAGFARDVLEKQREQAEAKLPIEPENTFTTVGHKIADDGFWERLIVKHNLKR